MRHSCQRAILVVLLLLAGLAGPGCDLQHSGGPGAPGALTPPPTPATPVVIYGCGLPRGSGDGHNCGREDARFADLVENAIESTMSNHPEWFDRNHALEVGRYVDEVVENLRRRGFCAFNDGEEVAVKENNDFNEQWDIISSGGNVIQIYTATCRPAWSAIPPAGNDS